MLTTSKMPCFTSLARKINLFNRDASELTRADVAITYIFISVTLYILTWYSQKYIRMSTEDFSKCQLPGNHTVAYCIKDELIHKGVPYIGVLNGFVIALFRGLNMVAIAINYACFCSYCCSSDENPNRVPEVRIEMNNVRDSVVDT